MSPRLFLLLAIAAAACSSTPSGAGPSPLDGGPTHDAHAADAPHAAHDDGSEGDAMHDDDAEVEALHDCTDDRFVDRRAATDDRTIRGEHGNAYDPPCMTVRVGQTVTFVSNFLSHPLEPGVAPRRSGAGTTPSPIEARSAGGTYAVRFASAGDYPYFCVYHAGGGMYGVVRVVP